LRRAALAMRIRNAAIAATTVAALVAAVSASSAALQGAANAGVAVDPTGSHVDAVAPTGFAWRDGVRPGQVVTYVGKADDPGGWRIETIGPDGPVVSAEAPVRDALRGTLPLALLSLAAASLGLLFLRTNRSWALPATCLALVAASGPLFLADGELTRGVLALGAIVPAGWVAWHIRGRLVLAGVLVASSVILVGWWAISRDAGSPEAADLEQLRRAMAVAGTGLLLANRALQVDRRAWVGPVTWHRLATWVGIGMLGTGALAVAYLAMPAPLGVVVILLVALGLPALWRFGARRLESILMADLRELAAADAADEERARIARELHDVTLQGLSATIRRLELLPEARAEADSLRAIADELRAVTIELRPPMLDDLGLAATLDYLAEQASGSSLSVQTAIRDATGIDVPSRPPAAVELAIYRISQEAIANAIRHSGGSEVDLTARIAAGSVELEIADNGHGIGAGRERQAMAEGRLGVASMRRRARAIGADLTLETRPTGTTVRVTWQR
jgi:signal transduction histidine kinase